MKLQAGQKLVMIGDSITDAERVKPDGEGLFGALGKGYVSLVDAFLQSRSCRRWISIGTACKRLDK